MVGKVEMDTHFINIRTRLVVKLTQRMLGSERKGVGAYTFVSITK